MNNRRYNVRITTPACRLAGFVVLLILMPLQAAALEVKDLWYELNSEFEYLEDSEGQLTIDDLLNHPADFEFIPSAESKPSITFKPIWLRLQLSRSEEARGEHYIILARLENLFDLRVYRPDAKGIYQEVVTGNNYPASTRELKAPRYGFNVALQQEPQVIYIRMVGGPGTNNLVWNLIEQRVYHSRTPTYYMITVGCFSAILALLLFNFAIAASLRRLDYLYYSAYVFSVLMALVTLEGFGFYKLWPDHPGFNQSATHTFNLLSATLRLMTIMEFLHLAILAPRVTAITRWVIGLLLLIIVVVNVKGISNLPPFAATIPWLVGILLSFGLCIYAIKARIALAWPLFIAFLIPSVTAIAQGLLTAYATNVGMVETQLAKLGFTLHVLLFSICLAAHLKQEIDSRNAALHDTLTDLPGVLLLQEHFDWQKRLAIREDLDLTVLFIDLDGFKQVNDTLGHAAGDELLRQVATRMSSEVRASDFVARIGGDEFAVLLSSEPDAEAATKVSRKLVDAIATPFTLGQQQATIGASIGIAHAGGEDADLDELLAAADSAMYQAKQNGKNGFAIANTPKAA